MKKLLIALMIISSIVITGCGGTQTINVGGTIAIEGIGANQTDTQTVTHTETIIEQGPATTVTSIRYKTVTEQIQVTEKFSDLAIEPQVYLDPPIIRPNVRFTIQVNIWNEGQLPVDNCSLELRVMPFDGDEQLVGRWSIPALLPGGNHLFTNTGMILDREGSYRLIFELYPREPNDNNMNNYLYWDIAVR